MHKTNTSRILTYFRIKICNANRTFTPREALRAVTLILFICILPCTHAKAWAQKAVNPAGYIDIVNCDHIIGWAADLNRPNTPVYVDIFDIHGSQIDYYWGVSANQLRPDVSERVTHDNGLHGFSFTFPCNLTLESHTISIKIAGTDSYLINSPQYVNCPTTDQLTKAQPFGTCLGKFNGVGAYSNKSSGYYSCDDPDPSRRQNCINKIDSNFTGVMWQCVEFIRRYYLLVYGLDLYQYRKKVTNANTWYNNASKMGLDHYENGKTNVAPRVGDILTSKGGKYGHVAIIQSVTNDKVCIIQQNFYENTKDITTCLDLKVSSGVYTLSGFSDSHPIQGWLRKPSTTNVNNAEFQAVTTSQTCPSGDSQNFRLNGSPPIHPNGTLVKVSHNNTVYLLQNGQRRPITAPDVLYSLYENGEFDFSDVITISPDEMSLYPLGGEIDGTLSSNGRGQPDGQLIKQLDKPEISIVADNGGRRPFVSESVFLGLGYQYCSVIVVEDYDSYSEGPPIDGTSDQSPIRNYIGFLDITNCNSITGWAANRNSLNNSINVSLYDGNTLLTTVQANQSRPDVGSYLGDNGLHGFNIPFPDSLKNGQPHSISVRFETSNTNLSGSPKQITCGSAAPNYAGYLDAANCNTISGWAADRNRLNSSINVSIYDGNSLVTTVLANQSRSDVGSYLGDNGIHGFNVPTPDSLKNGQPHSVRVKFESSGTDLSGSPKTISCGTAQPNYVGYLDVANCTTISGWAADKNRLSTSISVSLYDGATLLASMPAAQSRPDVGNYLGDNGLHGFSFITPASLKDGKPHSIRVRFEATTTDLNNSPGSITCGSAPPNYTGYVDTANCSTISGWAADRNRPNTSINVGVYDGATLITNVLANQSRPDVGSYLGDNGLHGFNVPFPANLRDGQPHSISVRFESSATNLSNSPKTLTCQGSPPPSTPVYEGFHDFVDCNNIGGWVRDVNNPGTRLSVSVFDDITGAQIASGTADQLRQDLVNAGKGDGKYGFTIPIPVGLKDGQTHNIRVKVTGTSFSLVGTPRSFNSSTSCPPPASPDLVITAVSGTTSVKPGGQIDISVTVLNQGGTSAGSFRLGLYFSTDTNISTSDTFFGSCNIGGLSAGASTTCSGPLTVPQLTPGTYFLGAIADDQNAVTESNEGNNTRASSSITVGGSVPAIGWEFDSLGNFEGWSAVNASAAAVHDGILFIDPAGSDPNIVSPALSVSASSYRTVVVRVASNGLDPFGNVYFKTQAENFYSADKRVEFTVQNCSLCGSAPFVTYTINMASNPKWTGTITGIRIDPANDGKAGTNSDSMGFDFVRLTP